MFTTAYWLERGCGVARCARMALGDSWGPRQAERLMVNTQFATHTGVQCASSQVFSLLHAIMIHGHAWIHAHIFKVQTILDDQKFEFQDLTHQYCHDHDQVKSLSAARLALCCKDSDGVTDSPCIHV